MRKFQPLSMYVLACVMGLLGDNVYGQAASDPTNPTIPSFYQESGLSRGHGSVSTHGNERIDTFTGKLQWLRFPRQTGHLVQRKLDTDSTANWTPSPAQTGHRFRSKLDSLKRPE